MIRSMLALLIVVAVPLAALAQPVPPGLVPPGMPPGSPAQGFASQHPLIGGMTISCLTAPDNGSLPVVFVSDYNLQDVGLAVPAQFAPSPMGPQMIAPPRIILNYSVLIQMPAEEQRFVGGHECAHHFLPAAFRMNENDADCWSAMEGAKQTWFDPSVFPRMQQTFANNPGNWSHAPGPFRFQHIVNCFNAFMNGTTVTDGMGDNVSPFIVQSATRVDSTDLSAYENAWTRAFVGSQYPGRTTTISQLYSKVSYPAWNDGVGPQRMHPR